MQLILSEAECLRVLEEYAAKTTNKKVLEVRMERDYSVHELLSDDATEDSMVRITLSVESREPSVVYR